jgi:hypothetical protein
MKLTSLLKCILLLPAFLITSCGKDNNNNPAPPPDNNCRIAVVTSKFGSTTTTYTLSYDNSSRISKIVVDDFYQNRYHFNYAQGVFTRDGYSDHWNGQLTNALRAELNSMGLPTLITEKSYSETPVGQPLNLSINSTYTYEYNSLGELQLATLKKEYISNPAGNYTSTTTYTWANGNVVKQEVTGGGIGSYEYYTDKPAQKGDVIAFNNLMSSGISPFKNKNLTKSLTDGATIVNINYEYDETGKIKTALLTGSTAASSRESRYQYSCN